MGASPVLINSKVLTTLHVTPGVYVALLYHHAWLLLIPSVVPKLQHRLADVIDLQSNRTSAMKPLAFLYACAASENDSNS
jgi:hypothetical protein